MTAISRRTFLARSSMAVAGGVVVRHATAAQNAARGGEYFYYDDRFPQALQLARELAARSELTAVRGDVTTVWNAVLWRASAASPLTLRGVTTESFYFCAKILLAERSHLETRIDRVDHDLYLWSIRTTRRKIQGT